MDTRTRLLLGTGALAVLQILHSVDVLRYADDASLVRLMLAPELILGAGLSLLACALISRGSSGGRLFAIGAGVLVSLGFIQHHLTPTYSGGANPYWTFEDGFRGDFIRWITVLAIVAVGIWTAWTAWRSRRSAAVAAV